MLAVLLTSQSGWVLVVLIATTILLPFLLRPTRLSRALGLVEGRPKQYLRRLAPHYWLGYVIAVVALGHALVPMSAGFAGRVNAAGLYLATGALGLIVSQVLLGRRLSEPTRGDRLYLRRWHFWSMIGIVVLGLGHVALDGPLAVLLVR